MQLSKAARRFLPKDVVIVGSARTVIGSFCGKMSALTAPDLGAMAITDAMRRAKVTADDIDYVYFGHVCAAGVGQAPARQAALKAGLHATTDVCAINKVCSSGLKAITCAANDIALGQIDVAIAGGMESMSNIPYALDKARSGGYGYGHGQFIDLLVRDGLWDVYNDMHMGLCSEKTVADFGITREDQDKYCIESYARATEAWKSGAMAKECVSVKIESRKGAIEINEDEEYSKVKAAKVVGLKPAFQREGGTITAANASSLNDGAAAVVLMSAEKAAEMGLKPLARIVSFADAAVAPIDFGTAPAQAVKSAMKRAGMDRVDYHEINEAFSSVALANIRLNDLDHSRVNVHGGAVSIGHPIGASGCRIVNTLLNVLDCYDASTGCVSICNGGGGGTAMIVERLN